MAVTHIDCNGKVIPDISKVVLPLDLSKELYSIILRSNERKAKEKEAEQKLARGN